MMGVDKLPVRMIVSDLDRTLLRSDKTISEYSVRILKDCQARGIRVVFATARPERATQRFQGGITPDYVIANNGATIQQGETVLRNLLIPAATRDALMQDLLAAEEVSEITMEAGRFVYTSYDGPPWEDGWNIVYTDYRDYADIDTPKLSAECRDAAWLGRVVGRYPDLHLYSNSGESWHQIMHKEATKLKAILYLCETLGYSLGEIAAFGDDSNDLEMVQACGWGIAVRNAIPEVQIAADWVCYSNDDDGVARWLEEHVL